MEVLEVVGRQMENETIKTLGYVKWFNQFKGYGFVESKEVPEDIFLHFSVIAQSGISRLNNRDVILCEVVRQGKGYQVANIEKVIDYNKYEPAGETQQDVCVTMKWFNPAKGFGFAQLDTGEDVFIHSNLLKKYKLDTIPHGSKIRVRIHLTNFGYEALDLLEVAQ